MDSRNFYGMGGPEIGRYSVARKPSKQSVMNWFRQYTGATEIDMVDDSYSGVARHICLGGTSVELLPKQTCLFEWEGGDIPIEYYQCTKCGKVILNRNFM